MNAIIRNIYEAEPEINQNGPLIYAIIHIKGGLWYGGQYVGCAKVHQEDKDFASKIVGATIATSRARISALKWAVKAAEFELTSKRDMWWQGTKGVKIAAYNADPFGNFEANVRSAEKKVKVLRTQLRSEKRFLTDYIAAQKDAVIKIRGYRAKKAENN